MKILIPYEFCDHEITFQSFLNDCCFQMRSLRDDDTYYQAKVFYNIDMKGQRNCLEGYITEMVDDESTGKYCDISLLDNWHVFSNGTKKRIANVTGNNSDFENYVIETMKTQCISKGADELCREF